MDVLFSCGTRKARYSSISLLRPYLTDNKCELHLAAPLLSTESGIETTAQRSGQKENQPGSGYPAPEEELYAGALGYALFPDQRKTSSGAAVRVVLAAPIAQASPPDATVSV